MYKHNETKNRALLYSAISDVASFSFYLILNFSLFDFANFDIWLKTKMSKFYVSVMVLLIFSFYLTTLASALLVLPVHFSTHLTIHSEFPLHFLCPSEVHMKC